jgi:hypothetical protein
MNIVVSKQVFEQLTMIRELRTDQYVRHCQRKIPGGHLGV